MGDGEAPPVTAVSRFMGDRFIRAARRGKTVTAGFRVRKALGHGLREVDWVVVEYEASSFDQWTLTNKSLLEQAQKVLRIYEEGLKERYDVARNDEDGPDEWNCLLVRTRKTE